MFFSLAGVKMPLCQIGLARGGSLSPTVSISHFFPFHPKGCPRQPVPPTSPLPDQPCPASPPDPLLPNLTCRPMPMPACCRCWKKMERRNLDADEGMMTRRSPHHRSSIPLLFYAYKRPVFTCFSPRYQATNKQSS